MEEQNLNPAPVQDQVNSQPETTQVVDTQVTPGGTLLMLVVTTIAGFVPLFGSAFSLNYMAGWIADNSTVQGKEVRFNATYMEALSFTFFNLLWLVLTLGIFIFWFIPRTYRYYTKHVEFA